LVGGIVHAAAPELVRRRGSATLTGALLAWARPALSAAATIAILLTVSAMMTRGGQAEASQASLASALVPEELVAWLVADYQPTVTEVVFALEEVVR
jgi:hypothetical protein